MDHKQRDHLVKVLVNIYNQDPKKIALMSDAQLEAQLKSCQQSELDFHKNPNKFWLIKGLPIPKQVEPTTSSKWGLIVVLTLLITLALFFGLFLYLAYRNN